MNDADERSVDPVKEMNRISRTVLEINAWGFAESYDSSRPAQLIYDSEWCRINFIWEGWDALGGNTMSIRYGRLHAPNEKAIMVWNGEECYCWHDIDHALNLLDGLRPADVVKHYYSHSVTDPFYENEFRKKFHHRQPEWLAQMHLAIWQYYGKRFFELFDLRRADLWQQYRQFLKEFYDIKGRRPSTNPSLDKVC
jgi:hypothetical protein